MCLAFYHRGRGSEAFSCVRAAGDLCDVCKLRVDCRCRPAL
uniref:Uncharacterized protein n=1 Tax=Arundo donax TaxID=35708 RepID=A0A0A9F7D4_ARUDO